ncbi:MAG TPA: alpha-1,4-glucan--maltose-1-phosphate maltosyltransferase, partial [Actinobacteria bacterium]|nr:alpha-1,4-glucan--maltose-1-phosphate maltosyltransferase [Actinomycetota bacterium]
EGKEEYRDSEKYEIKLRDWQAASKKSLTLAPFITKLNEIKNQNIALQRLRNITFHQSDSDQVIAYSKREGDNLILVVVNLDPFKAIETLVHWNLSALGLEDKAFEVTDLLDQEKYSWSRDTFIRLDPSRPMGRVAHIARVKK